MHDVIKSFANHDVIKSFSYVLLSWLIAVVKTCTAVPSDITLAYENTCMCNAYKLKVARKALPLQVLLDRICLNIIDTFHSRCIHRMITPQAIVTALQHTDTDASLY